MKCSATRPPQTSKHKFVCEIIARGSASLLDLVNHCHYDQSYEPKWCVVTDPKKNIWTSLYIPYSTFSVSSGNVCCTPVSTIPHMIFSYVFSFLLSDKLSYFSGLSFFDIIELILVRWRWTSGQSQFEASLHFGMVLGQMIIFTNTTSVIQNWSKLYSTISSCKVWRGRWKTSQFCKFPQCVGGQISDDRPNGCL